MCNFPTIKDAADVAIATMLSGIQVRVLLLNFYPVVSLHVQLASVVKFLYLVQFNLEINRRKV